MFNLTKQPSERFFTGVNFTNILSTGEFINLNESIVTVTKGGIPVDPDDTVVTAGSVYSNPEDIVFGGETIPANLGLFFQVAGGNVDDVFNIGIVVATSAGNIIEEDMTIYVVPS